VLVADSKTGLVVVFCGGLDRASEVDMSMAVVRLSFASKEAILRWESSASAGGHKEEEDGENTLQRMLRKDNTHLARWPHARAQPRLTENFPRQYQLIRLRGREKLINCPNLRFEGRESC